MAKDILGEALLDFQKGNYSEDLKTHLTLNHHLEVEKDVLPLPYLFRTFEEMPKLEKEALELCFGTILDIGCGAGSHSLHLREKGLHVTALDASKGAVETCRLRGIENYVHSNIIDFYDKRFDTLLLLMNGIGIAETIEKLGFLLDHLKTLLNPGGQILLDSSDIIYMFEQGDDRAHRIPADTFYYGEVTFSMEYKKKLSQPFKWLYLDYNTLRGIAHSCNFHCELVSEGEHYDYLARITSK